MKRLALALTITLLATGTAAAAPGALDTTFDDDGLLTVDLAGEDEFRDVLLQPDDKLVFAGNGSAASDFAVARLNPDGSGDTSFDSNGVIGVDPGGDSAAEAATRQSDGKIVAVGYVGAPDGGLNFAAIRLTPSGSLDPSFDGDGMLTIDHGGYDAATDVVVQPNGKIVIAGFGRATQDLLVTRLNPDGTPDASFDEDGVVAVDFGGGGDAAYGIALLRDGGIVAVGSASVGAQTDAVIVQLRADGSPDPRFDGDGRLTIDLGNVNDSGRNVIVQPDDKIVFAAGPGFVVARLNPDGSPDGSFDGDGVARVEFSDGGYASAMALQANGKLVVAGRAGVDPAMARLQPGGSLDTAFSFDGKITFGAEGVSNLEATAVQRDGRIVVAGDSGPDAFAARVEGDSHADGGGPALVPGQSGGIGGGGPGGGRAGGPGGVPRCAGKRATIVGTNRSERLKGTRRADVIVALGGNDKVAAGKGNDLICGGNGNDTADGGLGNDRLFGQNGNDKLGGAAGKDTIDGGGGKDKLSGGSGRDGCIGGAGKDNANCERAKSL